MDKKVTAALVLAALLPLTLAVTLNPNIKLGTSGTSDYWNITRESTCDNVTLNSSHIVFQDDSNFYVVNESTDTNITDWGTTSILAGTNTPQDIYLMGDGTSCTQYCDVAGIRAWYPLDTGLIQDACGNIPDGSNHGASLVSSNWCNAYDFEESESDWLNLTDDDNLRFDGGYAFSVRAIYTPESTPGNTYYTVVSNHRNPYQQWQIQVIGYGSPRIRFRVSQQGGGAQCLVSQTGNMQNQTKYEIVGTWDGVSNCSLWLNGSFNNSDTQVLTIEDESEVLTTIGKVDHSTQPFYGDGVIDEVVMAGEKWDSTVIANSFSYNRPWSLTTTPDFKRDPRIAPATAYKSGVYNCTWIPLDSNSATVNANVTWYVDGSQNSSWDVTGLSCSNNTVCGTSTNATAGSKYEDYVCSVILYDGSSNSGWQNSTVVEVKNSRPSASRNAPALGSNQDHPVILNVTVSDADGDSNDVVFADNHSWKEDFEDGVMTWTEGRILRLPELVDENHINGNWSYGYLYDGNDVASNDELAWYIEKEFTAFKPVWLNFTHRVYRGYYYKFTVTYDDDSTETVSQCTIEGDPGNCANNYLASWTTEDKGFNLSAALSNYAGKFIKKLRIAAHRLTAGNNKEGGMYIDDITLTGEVPCKNTGVSSGSSTTCSWIGLTNTTNYTWGVLTDDSVSLFASDYWHFFTQLTTHAPTIDDVKINGADSPSINPVEAGNAIVTIEFNVTDIDGTGNLNLSSAYANDTTDNIANTSCIASDFSDVDTQEVKCELTIPYYTAGSVKGIAVYIEDNGGVSGSDSAHSFTLNTIYVISLNLSTLDFGNLVVSSNNNPAALDIDNTGNGVLNVSVQGSNLVNGSDTVEVGNITVDDDSTADEGVETEKNELQLTTGAQDYSPVAGVAVQGDEKWWFFFDVPLGTPGLTFTSQSNWEVVSSQA